MRESNYWLRLLMELTETEKIDKDELKYLINESHELKLILRSIVSNTKK